jgi:iron complex transport system permease protein
MSTLVLRFLGVWPARRRVAPGLWLAAALGLGLLLAVQAGAVPVTRADWLSLFDAGTAPGGGAYVLWHLRLPRALFAVLVGAAMALAGGLTQGLFRNPLADPGLLGVNAGAACAAALCIVLFSGLALPLPAAWRAALLPAAAFGGALAVCFTLDRVARWITPGSIAGLLLTGVALNALAAAVIGLCTYLASDEQLRSLSFWTLGSLAAAGWGVLGGLAGLLLFALWRVRRLLQAMNALALGEAAAAAMGVDVAGLRRQVVAGGLAGRLLGGLVRHDRLHRPGRAAPGAPLGGGRPAPRAAAVHADGRPAAAAGRYPGPHGGDPGRDSGGHLHRLARQPLLLLLRGARGASHERAAAATRGRHAGPGPAALRPVHAAPARRRAGGHSRPQRGRQIDPAQAHGA